MKKICFVYITLFLFTQCSKKKEVSFYFWKTTYAISAYEEKYLDCLAVERLYVRFFDIDIKNGKAVPVGEISILQKNDKQEIIPVIFITNETFKKLDKKAIEILASNIIKETAFIYPKISAKKVKELQFDCDWTSSTKSKYFYFLDLVERQNPSLQISVTIRLHQIKDKNQTGVPPVKKGVLMYYATSNPLDFAHKNSILDNEIACNYILNMKDYPLTLDIALPIYSWAIIQNQLGEKRLVNDIRASELQNSLLYDSIRPDFYHVKKDHYLKGNYLYEDFMIKTEAVTLHELRSARMIYSKKIKNKNHYTIFFQLDSSNLSHYSIQDFKTILK